MRINDLISQCSCAEIWPLRDIGELACWRLVYGPAVYGPQTAKYPEEGGFAAAIRSDY
jgi:hypothetical protein